MAELIDVTVCYALPERQWLELVQLPVGATVKDAIVQSRITEKIKDLEFNDSDIGVYGKRVSMEQVLADGDRVEIYRPLQMDPKEIRRMRAEAAKAGKSLS